MLRNNHHVHFCIILENLEGIKFIAVHYRFDKDDWMKHCSESTAVNPACEKVIDILNDIPKDRVQSLNFSGFSGHLTPTDLLIRMSI